MRRDLHSLKRSSGPHRGCADRAVAAAGERRHSHSVAQHLSNMQSREGTRGVLL